MQSVKDAFLIRDQSHNVGYVVRICAVAALGGFLFGYDTSVISGALGPLTEHFELGGASTGWAVSSVVLGCIIGAFSAGLLAKTLGRRNALFICALLFLVQAVGAALAPTFFQFIFYRILGGVAVGIASVVSPMYISEVSPKDMRGRALIMQQFAIVVGQLVVYVINYLIAVEATHEWLVELGWRWMLASAVVPCVVFLLVLFFIPESPRWYAMRNKDQQAFKTLSRISNPEHAQVVLSEIKESLRQDSVHSSSFRALFRNKTALWIIFVGSMVAGLQQLTGVNIVVYYAPLLLGSTGDSIQEALFQTIWVGAGNFAGCILGAWLIDRIGRRPLVKWGSLGMACGLLIASWALYTQSQGPVAVLGLMLFMTTFGFSWGPITWVLVSEVFPNRMRSVGMSIAGSSNWIFNFLVAQSFPMLASNAFLSSHFHGAFPMWLFAVLCLAAMWFVLKYVPETKGVALENIEALMMTKQAASKE
ncbi:sugar porter family MFS transporter [Carnimonas nigrificans]|uniref:sugar porter family MFS transporter n=1 Tax=Carnimonas nigrificans TaxID=64323 RepID=UPI00046EA0B1|nr:sugar porter family MFS transporter [Carnimonas nigrificans]